MITGWMHSVGEQDCDGDRIALGLVCSFDSAEDLRAAAAGEPVQFKWLWEKPESSGGTGND